MTQTFESAWYVKFVVLATSALLVAGVLFSAFLPDNPHIDNIWKFFWGGFGFITGQISGMTKRSGKRIAD